MVIEWTAWFRDHANGEPIELFGFRIGRSNSTERRSSPPFAGGLTWPLRLSAATDICKVVNGRQSRRPATETEAQVGHLLKAEQDAKATLPDAEEPTFQKALAREATVKDRSDQVDSQLRTTRLDLNVIAGAVCGVVPDDDDNSDKDEDGSR